MFSRRTNDVNKLNSLPKLSLRSSRILSFLLHINLSRMWTTRNSVKPDHSQNPLIFKIILFLISIRTHSWHSYWKNGMNFSWIEVTCYIRFFPDLSEVTIIFVQHKWCTFSFSLARPVKWLGVLRQRMSQEPDNKKFYFQTRVASLCCMISQNILLPSFSSSYIITRIGN